MVSSETKRFSDIRKKLDGLVAIAREWTFLGHGYTFSLPKNVAIGILSSDRIKGVKCLKLYKTYTISLNIWKGLQLSQLICLPMYDRRYGPGSETEPEERPEYMLEYNFVRAAFIESVDESILNMGHRSQLYKTVKTGICCNTYAKRLGKTCTTCKEQRKTIPVIFGEIEDFGAYFQATFQEKLEQRYSNVKTYLCAMEMGQDGWYDHAINALPSLNLEDVQEIVLHLAVDITSPVGEVMFWKLNKVKKFINSEDKMQMFWPAFTTTVGNFVLTLKNEQAYNAKTYSADCQIIKFYSSLLREQAKYNPKPFSFQVLGKLLAGDQHLYSAEWVLACIAAIRESLRLLEEEQCTVLRCEAIISVTNPADADLFTWCDIATVAADEFDKKLGCAYKPLIEKVPFHQLRRHISKTLEPLLDTTKWITEDFIKKNKQLQRKRGIAERYLPPLEDFVLASICECLLCFYIYGNAIWREGKKLFPTELVSALGLRQRNIFEIGPNNGAASNVFLDFKCLRKPPHNRQLSNYLHVCTYNNERGKLMVKYEGRCKSIEAKYQEPLESVMENIDWTEFWAILENFPRSREATFDANMTTLSHMFWKVLQAVAFEKFACAHTLPALCSLLDTTITLELESSRDFVHKLLTEECLVSQQMQRFISTIRRHLSRHGLKQFIKHSAKFLEREIYNTSGAFLFPAVGNSEIVAAITILPMFHFEGFDYNELSPEQKNRITNRYDQVYRNLTCSNPFPRLTCFVGTIDWEDHRRGCISLDLAWQIWSPE